MKLLSKKDGFETIPLCSLLIIFLMAIVIILIVYQESERICFEIDDAVTMSIQGVCLFDRYEYATGRQNKEAVVCFYPGAADIRYGSDDTDNMAVTKSACSYAYDKYLRVLLSNISSKYVIVPSEAAGGIASYAKKFEMINVYDGTAYVYDIISGTTNIITPATGLKTTLTVEMEMDMDFPLYGRKTIRLEETGKLEDRLN